MSKLSSFTFITLNGFFKGENEDTSWHKHGGEASKYADSASQGGSILLFGRKTYEMMASFWPTPMAQKSFPVVAENMNASQKIVCSNTLKKAGWHNTTIINGNLIEEIKLLKKKTKKGITILGSGSLVTQLSDAGLIDKYIIMLDPVALGRGTSLFDGIQDKLELKLISVKTFKKDGILVFTYEKEK